jgi:hypothetical protein
VPPRVAPVEGRVVAVAQPHEAFGAQHLAPAQAQLWYWLQCFLGFGVTGSPDANKQLNKRTRLNGLSGLEICCVPSYSHSLAILLTPPARAGSHHLDGRVAWCRVDDFTVVRLDRFDRQPLQHKVLQPAHHRREERYIQGCGWKTGPRTGSYVSLACTAGALYYEHMAMAQQNKRMQWFRGIYVAPLGVERAAAGVHEASDAEALLRRRLLARRVVMAVVVAMAMVVLVVVVVAVAVVVLVVVVVLLVVTAVAMVVAIAAVVLLMIVVLVVVRVLDTVRVAVPVLVRLVVLAVILVLSTLHSAASCALNSANWSPRPPSSSATRCAINV